MIVVIYVWKKDSKIFYYRILNNPYKIFFIKIWVFWQKTQQKKYYLEGGFQLKVYILMNENVSRDLGRGLTVKDYCGRAGYCFNATSGVVSLAIWWSYGLYKVKEIKKTKNKSRWDTKLVSKTQMCQRILLEASLKTESEFSNIQKIFMEHRAYVSPCGGQ